MSSVPQNAGRAFGASENLMRGKTISGLDPRTRLVATLAFAVTSVALAHIPALVLALFSSVMVMLATGLPIVKTLRRMAAMDGFIVFILVLLPFTMPGEPILTIWGFTASWDGLHKAIIIALKANAVVLMLLALVGTLEAVTLAKALHALHVPASLVHLLQFTVRYIEVLEREYQRLRAAMKARGFRPKNSLHTYKSFGYLIGMMLVRALERSERILDAMKCRGFDGTIPVHAAFSFNRRDGVFVLAMSTVLAALVLVEFTWA